MGHWVPAVTPLRPHEARGNSTEGWGDGSFGKRLAEAHQPASVAHSEVPGPSRRKSFQKKNKMADAYLRLTFVLDRQHAYTNAHMHSCTHTHIQTDTHTLTCTRACAHTLSPKPLEVIAAPEWTMEKTRRHI